MNTSRPENSGFTETRPGAGYLVIWEFVVQAEARAAFEKAYAPEGDWAQLFRVSPEFMGTRLVRDLSRPERYLTLDHWTSREGFLKFKQAHETAYKALDRRCEALAEHETLLGEFEI